jgi:hypothetical protein
MPEARNYVGSVGTLVGIAMLLAGPLASAQDAPPWPPPAPSAPAPSTTTWPPPAPADGAPAWPPPAGQPASPAAPAAPDAPSPALWAGGQFDLLPIGSLHIAANGDSDSADAGRAIGLGAVIDYRIQDLISIGFAPRFILPVQVEDAGDSGTQLDLRARATVGAVVAPRVHFHGIVTLGYSMMFHVLSDLNGTYYRSSGLIVGFGAGVAYSINPRLKLLGEMSYQLGYQGTTIAGFDVEAGDSYFTMGIGLLTAL